MISVQLGLNRSWIIRSRVLGILILLLEILIVELGIIVLLVVHPGANLVWVLLVEMAGCWKGVHENVLAIEADMVALQGIITPKHHLAPQVRVLPTLVHGSVWLEILLNEVLVFVDHSLDLLLAGIVFKNLVEVAPNSVLLIVESVEVDSLDGVDMHCHQLTESTPEENEIGNG